MVPQDQIEDDLHDQAPLLERQFHSCMEKAPSTSASGTHWDPLAPLGDIVEIRMVSLFRLISTSWKMIPEVFWGSLFHMPPKGVPRHHQRIPKAF